MLPEPTLTLTLPSIHDGTVLDCRIFHPYSLSPSPRAPPWQKHAAVIAHPYAPLGGCYDDPVVDVVATTLLRLGFLVGTFNFRGASGSAGRTSWTARAERADYMSFVGFISHYAHHLDPFRRKPDHPALDALHTSAASQPSPPPEPDGPASLPLLLLAGYSYGAMITVQLPSLETISAAFATPASGSPAAEIRHRAEHLAAAQNTVLGDARAATLKHQQGTKSPRKSLGLRVGGDEDNRRSHDSVRRSFSSEAEEKLRKGVADVVARAKRGHHHHKVKKGDSRDSSDIRDGEGDAGLPAVSRCDDRLPALPSPPQYRTAYVLISPLQGVITNLATMSFSNPFSKKKTKKESPVRTPGESSRPNDDHQPISGPAQSDTEQKLVRNPTLAVYGDQDVFVAARKLRDWARRLEGYPDSRFRAHEISTATHFWTEERVVYLMQEAVKTFAEGVLGE